MELKINEYIIKEINYRQRFRRKKGISSKQVLRVGTFKVSLSKEETYFSFEKVYIGGERRVRSSSHGYSNVCVRTHR